ncbi:hypothetical protein GCM10027413_03360 [Conyzicola nivalis]|uniref:Uncharacterized protein n=1 Tax=Conyzicola nivalis TaxID=1477021 RepID=A0A916WL54_9MICO|nr:hypothetical protein [Conyzicola nivalis]GGB08099.1 hypothetical protein GCM10010979_23280 [Conyzicola nivalis]
MDNATLVVSACVGIIAVVGLAATFVPWYGRWRAYQQSAYLRVDLPTRLERAVSSRLISRERGGIIGAAALGGLAVLGFATGIVDGLEPSLTIFFIVGAVFVGVGVGTAIAALTGKKEVPSDVPRVARSEAASVADYIAPIERIGARVCVAIVVALAIAVGLAGPSADDLLLPVTLFAAAAILTLALFEMASRRIVEASQPAGSTAELVWDDAIRASVIRDLVTAPLALSVYGTVFGVFALADRSIGAAAATAYLGSALVIAGFIITVVVSAVTRPRRYFLDRLWPNLRWSDTADVATDAA